MSDHGTPCWYELGTSDLTAAGEFYAAILGWNIISSGMEGFDYRLGRVGDAMVAGMMSLDAQDGAPPPNWNIYFAVDDCDRAAAEIAAAGGTILMPPADIPGTGRFAVTRDPQGVVFGILQPLPMAAPSGGSAFDQKKTGHACWNELMTPDPDAAYAFYSRLFGWAKGQAMDMGDGSDGVYQLIRHDGADIGAIQPQENAPYPAWLPYFSIEGSVAAKIAAIKAAGGQVHFGPQEVPGPAFIAICTDPQGANFAIIGPQE